MAQRRVFVDTNVIIGAFGGFGGQNRAWRAICGHFSVETVQACANETQEGNRDRPGYVEVSPSELRRLAAIHQVTPDMVRGIQQILAPGGLDLGELHLLAWLYARESRAASASQPPLRPLPPGILIATADIAARQALRRLGWLDHAVSLEWLAAEAGG